MADHYAGWYPDPSGDASKLRYWDGAQWTNHYTDAQQGVLPTPPFGQASETPPGAQPTAGPQVYVKETVYTNTSGSQARYDQVYVQVQPDSSKRTMRLIAFILCLVSTIVIGWLIIPLAWMIPMTVHSWGIYQGTKDNSVAFGVCTLLFVNLVGGILLLVSGED